MRSIKRFFRSSRKLIDSKESKVSVLQLIGFLLMLLAISYLLVNLYRDELNAADVSVNFMIIMLGFCFTFPSVLEGNDGLSTMRIVVFMMTNVICMLLLKTGWGKEIHSLTDIGLDQYWVGIIAFVFGAKAVQSFFESRMAVPKEMPRQGMAALNYSGTELARLAIAQNETFLKVRFPNILSVSDTVYQTGNNESHVVALYLKDNKTAGLPDKLGITMPDGSTQIIPTEIISSVGTGSIHIGQRDEVSNGIKRGSVCCIAETYNGEKKLVTAGHVYTNGNSASYGGELSPAQQSPVQINRQVVGNWFFQVIDYKNDLALGSIDNWIADIDLISFRNKDHYEVSDRDVGKTRVTVVSNASYPKTRQAWILDHNTAWDIPYADNTVRKNNIILIGDHSDRAYAHSVSVRGDSGGCVYENATGNLVGLILGGNNKYTWVLPLKEIFETYNYTLA